MPAETSPLARSDISSGFQRSAQDIITEVHHSLRPLRCRHVDFATKAAVVSIRSALTFKLRRSARRQVRACPAHTLSIHGDKRIRSAVLAGCLCRAHHGNVLRTHECLRLRLDTAQERGPLRSATTAAVHAEKTVARYPFFAHRVGSSGYQWVAHNDSAVRGAFREVRAGSTVAVFCTQALS